MATTEVSLPVGQAARPAALVYAVLLLGAAALLAFVGYLTGFLGFIYGVMLPGRFEALGAYALALVVGVAAFFSPCAFPLLPAYVSHALSLRDGAGAGRSLRLGLSAAAGLVLVVLVVGAVIVALGAAAPFQPDPRQDPAWLLGIRVAAGLAIAVFGLLALTGRSHVLTRFLPHGGGQRVRGPEEAGRGAARGMFLYGLAYSAAGIGCTGPLLLALMLYAFAFASPFVALAAFALFAATMGALMVAVTVLTGFARRGAVDRLRAAGPSLQRVAGGVALVVGAWTVFSVTVGLGLFVRLFFRFLSGA